MLRFGGVFFIYAITIPINLIGTRKGIRLPTLRPLFSLSLYPLYSLLKNLAKTSKFDTIRIFESVSNVYELL